MQLKKRARRNAPTYNEKSCPNGTRRQLSDFNQTNNHQGVSTGKTYSRGNRSSSSYTSQHRYRGPRIPFLPGDNGRYVVTEWSEEEHRPRMFSFDPATINQENFPDTFAAWQAARLPEVTPIPVEETKRFRGTQHQYEQRGMVLNAPMKMKGRRTVMHHSRMRKQEGQAALRRQGIHHPTPIQVEMYFQGAQP